MAPADTKTLIDAVRIAPGAAPKLAKRKTDESFDLPGKDETLAMVQDLIVELDGLHDRLWAEEKRSVLLVLQGMDAAGKDGTIRRVLTGLNPQGCKVAGFQAPSDDELLQDYLWRVHNECPPRGQIGVFNRSHYEDVLAARMIGVASPEQCKKRYRHLIEFERMLVDEGTTPIKVFLHISKEEQRIRLQERIDNPDKRWKFREGDLKVREQWDEYHTTYEEVIAETSTEHAPWHVVPADRKWVRDYVVATLLVSTLQRLAPEFPEPDPAFDGLKVV